MKFVGKIPDILECLPCREALRWECYDLTLTDFKSFAHLSVTRAIKYLAVDTGCIGDFVIGQISAFGPTLLSLELKY